MPSAHLSLARSALDDLRAIRAWYRQEQVPEVGEQLLRKIFAQLEALPEHPQRGRQVPEFEQPWLRELIIPPFRVVYRIDRRDRIRVVRVWRSERLLQLPEAD